MKLTRSKLLETIRTLNKGSSAYQARKIAGISIRRVYQIWNEYLEKGKLPEIGRAMGRPTRPITPREIEIVEDAYNTYLVSASSLERIIERDYGLHLPHNHIHKIMLKLGLARRKQNKDIRKKKWKRYERRHSLTAVHIDWHFNAEKRIWVFLVIDDASRMVLALLECDSRSTANSIRGMQLALQHGKIKQCISDHGAEFTCNRDGKSRFATFMKKQEIKHILCKVKHPQSNGKAEKFFHLYDTHRWKFDLKEDFLVWYNKKRPHMSLRFEELETPQLAFERKAKAEVL
jgi:putative transposase